MSNARLFHLEQVLQEERELEGQGEFMLGKGVVSIYQKP